MLDAPKAVYVIPFRPESMRVCHEKPDIKASLVGGGRNRKGWALSSLATAALATAALAIAATAAVATAAVHTSDAACLSSQVKVVNLDLSRLDLT